MGEMSKTTKYYNVRDKENKYTLPTVSNVLSSHITDSSKSLHRKTIQEHIIKNLTQTQGDQIEKNCSQTPQGSIKIA
jgi:hypothetical protein